MAFSAIEKLAHLRDTDPSGVSDGDALVWDDTAQAWVPGTVAAAAGDWSWAGTWDAGTPYTSEDVVAHEGSSYVATAATTGDEPPASPWELVAAAGDATDVTSISGGSL